MIIVFLYACSIGILLIIYFQTKKERANLRCVNVVANSHWLRLGPLRMEEIWHDPQIVKFQNILYESECDFITDYIGPYLSPWFYGKKGETKSEFRRMKK